MKLIVEVRGRQSQVLPMLIKEVVKATQEGWTIPNDFENLGDCRMFNNNLLRVVMEKEGDNTIIYRKNGVETIEKPIVVNKPIEEAIQKHDEIAVERVQEAEAMVEQLTSEAQEQGFYEEEEAVEDGLSAEDKAKLQAEFAPLTKKVEMLAFAEKYGINVPDTAKYPAQVKSVVEKAIA